MLQVCAQDSRGTGLFSPLTARIVMPPAPVMDAFGGSVGENPAPSSKLAWLRAALTRLHVAMLSHVDRALFPTRKWSLQPCSFMLLMRAHKLTLLCTCSVSHVFATV